MDDWVVESAINRMMHPADYQAFLRGRVDEQSLARLKRMFRKEIERGFEGDADGDSLADAVDQRLDEMYENQGPGLLEW